MRQEKLEELNKIIEEFKTTEVFEPDIDKNEKFLTTKIRKFKLKNGKTIIIDQLYKNGKEGCSAIILPVTKSKNVLLVIQPRVFTKRGVGIELPAGYVENGETTIDAAKRELREETGYEAEELICVGSFYQDQGCSGAINNLFVALGCEKKYDQHLDEDEFVKYFECTYDEAIELVEMGYIQGAESVLTIEKSKTIIKNNK